MSPFDSSDPIVLQQLDQSEDYRSPFDPNVPGYTTDWWKRGWGRVGDETSVAFVASQGGEEVARVITDPSARLHIDQYVGLRPLVAAVEVFRFEVRVHKYRSGIGRRVAASIGDHYRARDLYTFGDTDQFWRGIGWLEQSRADGDGHHAPLFVLRQM